MMTLTSGLEQMSFCLGFSSLHLLLYHPGHSFDATYSIKQFSELLGQVMSFFSKFPCDSILLVYHIELQVCLSLKIISSLTARTVLSSLFLYPLFVCQTQEMFSVNNCCYRSNCVPVKRYVEVLNSSACECDLTWK
jgi:hypothetical protein